MTKQAIDALRAIHEQVTSVCGQVSVDDWSKPSACEGWRVQDVLAHMTSNMKETVEPTEPAADAPPPPEHAEEQVALLVDVRKDWTPDQLLSEYEQYAEGWLAGLAAMQEEPLATTPMQFADLGEYPMHLVANAYAFDHYCHLWIDLVGPEGPLDAGLVAEATDEMVRPGIDWMIAGLPQMQPQEMRATITAPLRLDLTGAGGGSWLLTPAAGDGLVGVEEVDAASGAEVAATVTSSAHDFVSWGTQRSSWRGSCEVSGDRAAAEPFLDALNII